MFALSRIHQESGKIIGKKLTIDLGRLGRLGSLHDGCKHSQIPDVCASVRFLLMLFWNITASHGEPWGGNIFIKSLLTVFMGWLVVAMLSTGYYPMLFKLLPSAFSQPYKS
ncbi:hypothetical protein BU17DRAFT_70041 [Hysterangium stoloniferum]|nr:hypothetical protein BU17DRAFT_70041 [Hysterangium stoloniferum]